MKFIYLFALLSTISSRVIPRSSYDIKYSGKKQIRGKNMHEFKVIGGPYQTRVNYYFDSNGEYFHDHENNDNNNNIGVLSRDEIGIKLANVYNNLV